MENNENDIDFDTFEQFTNSDDFKKAFDEALSSSINTAEQSANNSSVLETSGDFSGDFSFGEYEEPKEQDVGSARQEPYFESSQDDAYNNVEVSFNTSDEQPFVNNNEFTEAFTSVEEPMVEEHNEFTEAFTSVEEPMVEEYNEFTEAFTSVEEPMVEEHNEFTEAFTSVEEPMVEEYNEFTEAFTAVEEPMVEGNDFVQEIENVSETEYPVVEANNNESDEQDNIVETVPETAVYENVQYDETPNFTDASNVQYSGVYEVDPSVNMKYLKWYSGNSTDDVYEFGKSSESTTFVATNRCRTIHVNIGHDTYGWMVQFADDVTMSLRDVKEYQLRNGRLPNSSGRIVYGQTCLTFEKVERIVVYEAVRYFSYGA